MDKIKNTPWHYNDDVIGVIGHCVVNSRGKMVASACGPSNAKKHAHLISAAPDLYEACAEFVRKVDAREARSTSSYNQMKAALSKASPTEGDA